MRKLIAIAVMILMAALGLAACGTSSDTGENWRPINVTLDGSVENIACDQIDSAIRQVNKAVDKQDEDLLKQLGLLDGNKVSDKVDSVRKRLDTTKSSCNQVKVEASAADCPDGTPLKYDPNQGLNVKTGGVKNSKEDLEAIKEDPRNLAYRGHNLKLWEDANNWKPLTTNEGKCLSKDGEILYAKVEGALTASTTKVDENAIAPAGYYNTGMNQNGPVVNPTPGITGNLDAIIYTLPDGTKVIVLKRCANLALPSAPPQYTKVEVPGSTPPGEKPPTTVPPTNPPTNPPTTTPPGPSPKVPSQDPYPRGNAPQGGGQNATPGPGVQQPYTPPPAAPYTPPPPPAYTPPPAPPVVTQQPPKPNPTTVVPSTQPPNNGSVVPTPGGDFG